MTFFRRAFTFLTILAVALVSGGGPGGPVDRASAWTTSPKKAKRPGKAERLNRGRLPRASDNDKDKKKDKDKGNGNGNG